MDDILTVTTIATTGAATISSMVQQAFGNRIAGKLKSTIPVVTAFGAAAGVQYTMGDVMDWKVVLQNGAIAYTAVDQAYKQVINKIPKL